MSYTATYEVRQGLDDNPRIVRKELSSTTELRALEDALTIGTSMCKDFPHNNISGSRSVLLYSLTGNEGQEIAQHNAINEPYARLVDGKMNVTFSYMDKICQGLEPDALPQTD